MVHFYVDTLEFDPASLGNDKTYGLNRINQSFVCISPLTKFSPYRHTSP